MIGTFGATGSSHDRKNSESFQEPLSWGGHYKNLVPEQPKQSISSTSVAETGSSGMKIVSVTGNVGIGSPWLWDSWCNQKQKVANQTNYLKMQYLYIPQNANTTPSNHGTRCYQGWFAPQDTKMSRGMDVSLIQPARRKAEERHQLLGWSYSVTWN